MGFYDVFGQILDLLRQPPSPPPQPVPAAAQPARVAPSPVVPPTPDAERRQLTVLFCDLVDSTTLSGQLAIDTCDPKRSS